MNQLSLLTSIFVFLIFLIMSGAALMAAETGFGSRNSFINDFKKVTGMTPSAYKDYICKEGLKN